MVRYKGFFFSKKKNAPKPCSIESTYRGEFHPNLVFSESSAVVSYSREKEGGGVARNFEFMLTIRLGVDRTEADVGWKLCGCIHDNHTPSLSKKSHRNQKLEPKD